MLYWQAGYAPRAGRRELPQSSLPLRAAVCKASVLVLVILCLSHCRLQPAKSGSMIVSNSNSALMHSRKPIRKLALHDHAADLQVLISTCSETAFGTQRLHHLLHKRTSSRATHSHSLCNQQKKIKSAANACSQVVWVMPRALGATSHRGCSAVRRQARCRAVGRQAVCGAAGGAAAGPDGWELKQTGQKCAAALSQCTATHLAFKVYEKADLATKGLAA